jgi:Ca-activated chloride channel homolog
MRVHRVGTFRRRLAPCPRGKVFHGHRSFLGNSRKVFALLARLAAAAILLTCAAAQDASSTPMVSPPGSNQQTSNQQTTTVSPNASNAPASASETASPPQQPDTEGGGFVFRKEVEEVALRAIVVDQQNHLISGLSREAFSVYEDGKLQRMTSFRQENAPLALGILIDNSGSMRPKRQKVNDAVLNLVRSSNPGDEVFVVNFGDQSYLDQDFTDDVGKLTAALNKVETRGTTALYDAIVASAAHVRQDAKVQKRVLLVVTDGRDNASQDSLEEAMQQLQSGNGPVVYVIAFVDETKGATSTIQALQRMSQNTGGAAYFPSDLSEVDAVTKSIAHDIRYQYVIGYKSSNTSASRTYHRIEVLASDASRQRLRVRTRTGYYSGELNQSP